MSKAHLNLVFSEEHKLNISKAHKKRFASMAKKQRKEYFKYLLLANQETWDKMTKEERLKRCQHWLLAGQIASQKANPSSIEKLIWKELDKLGIEYKTQVPFANGWFIVDIYVPIWGTIIECNGDYWHNYEKFPKSKIRDEALEKYANRIGLRVVWLWEHDIAKDTEGALKNGLKKFFERRVKINVG